MFKLLLTWNIRHGFEAEYFEFVRQELAPGLADLGIRLTDSWFTYYGDHPQVLTGGVTDNLDSLQQALSSDTWRELRKKLLGYVTDYGQKVIRADGSFQL